jgi:hypothetical protein
LIHTVQASRAPPLISPALSTSISRGTAPPPEDLASKFLSGKESPSEMGNLRTRGAESRGGLGPTPREKDGPQGGCLAPLLCPEIATGSMWLSRLRTETACVSRIILFTVNRLQVFPPDLFRRLTLFKDMRSNYSVHCHFSPPILFIVRCSIIRSRICSRIFC